MLAEAEKWDWFRIILQQRRWRWCSRRELWGRGPCSQTKTAARVVVIMQEYGSLLRIAEAAIALLRVECGNARDIHGYAGNILCHVTSSGAPPEISGGASVALTGGARRVFWRLYASLWAAFHPAETSRYTRARRRFAIFAWLPDFVLWADVNEIWISGAYGPHNSVTPALAPEAEKRLRYTDAHENVAVQSLVWGGRLSDQHHPSGCRC